MTTPRKSVPGWRTTEFWMALSVVVMSLVLALTNKIEGEMALAAAAAAAGPYAISRAITKR